jgi:hypothetical protein
MILMLSLKMGLMLIVTGLAQMAMADGPKLFQFWGGLRVNICKNDEDT